MIASISDCTFGWVKEGIKPERVLCRLLRFFLEHLVLEDTLAILLYFLVANLLVNRIKAMRISDGDVKF